MDEVHSDHARPTDGRGGCKMSLRVQFITEVERKIPAPHEMKDRPTGDLLAHFNEGTESGES